MNEADVWASALPGRDLRLGNVLMPTPFILDDSVKDPHASIWFAVPAGFTELPIEALLASPESSEADELRVALAPLIEAIPDGVARQQFITQLAQGQQLLLALREVGTSHCSLGLHRDDTEGGEGRTLLSLFTVSWREIKISPPAMSAARAVATAEQHAHIEYAELPCGPVSISETIRIPTVESGLPQDPLLQVYAHLPHPDGKRMAILTLGTTAVARREQYRSLLRQIAELVSFDNPLAQAEDEGRRP
ncbi:hypothetical protein [Streptomyces sporangiiformans]|uniref:Uncharacterized protein n=1 Tax=Streptomyces sporangiiformans TaxID=2315329 RepID=A0A505D944_9ACTN|nr:hypothetical protein [Streptomyces sporangiiformans]TPQ20234.1 hypothetical protein FGD71_021450 [Streptomyces sporangiiformans]